jgi:hypothetical protein
VTIPVSLVPSVVAYLATAIQTQLDTDPLSGQILLALGDPGPDLPPDIVNIGAIRRTTGPETFIGSGGRYWISEHFDVDCGVSTWTGDGPTAGALTVPNALTLRAWQLLSYVEAAVRLDPSLGELVNVAYPAAATTQGPTWTTNPAGLMVEITFPIHVEVLN